MVTINPESCFGNGYSSPTVDSPDDATRPCSPQLQDIVETFPFLVWLEDKSGRIFFSNNQPPNLHWPLAETVLAAIRQSLQAPPHSCTVSIPDKYGHPAALNASSYPLPCLDTTRSPLRLVALCPVSKMRERDRVVISSLIAKLLQNNPKEQVSSRLTPQQHAIYQTLVRGCRYKEIAAHLGISHLTVRVQITRMRKILGPGFIPILRRSR